MKDFSSNVIQVGILFYRLVLLGNWKLGCCYDRELRVCPKQKSLIVRVFIHSYSMWT
jgi:hypothetical protein